MMIRGCIISGRGIMILGLGGLLRLILCLQNPEACIIKFTSRNPAYTSGYSSQSYSHMKVKQLSGFVGTNRNLLQNVAVTFLLGWTGFPSKPARGYNSSMKGVDDDFLCRNGEKSHLQASFYEPFACFSKEQP